MLRAVIIDDEQAGINALQLLLNKHLKDVKVIGTATKAVEGVSLIENYHPEIVFLDISMPGMNGFELLNELSFRDFKVIFTTAHEEYAIQAIRYVAFDYLLKPVDVKELVTCIDRIRDGNEKAGTTFSNTISVPVKDGILFIKYTELVRLEASGSYTVFYLENKIKHVASKSLKEFEGQLNPAVFYRCHNSHLVNLKKVVKFLSSEGFSAQMSDGSVAEIARKNKDEFLERLKNVRD